MDDTYQIYVNRVVRMALPETFKSRLQNVQASPKFRVNPTAGTPEALPFPGFTIINPPAGNDTDNSAFYTQLQTYQEQLLQRLGTPLFALVPPGSFHVTLADLIWQDAYLHAAKDPDFESKLSQAIAQIFEQQQASTQGQHEMRWQMVGLLIMARAIGVCLAPKDEASYQTLINLRRAIYQDQSLMALGIEQQYHLTAHVTLGYFCDVPPGLESGEAEGLIEEWEQKLTQLSDQWLLETSPELVIKQAELRKFDDMTRYYRQPDWPILRF